MTDKARMLRASTGGGAGDHALSAKNAGGFVWDHTGGLL